MDEMGVLAADGDGSLWREVSQKGRYLASNHYCACSPCFPNTTVPEFYTTNVFFVGQKTFWSWRNGAGSLLSTDQSYGPQFPQSKGCLDGTDRRSCLVYLGVGDHTIQESLLSCEPKIYEEGHLTDDGILEPFLMFLFFIFLPWLPLLLLTICLHS